MIQKTAPAPRAAKTSKRSIFGLLFNPQLGASFAPLRDTNKVFLHLLAAIFAIYGLFPKDHPALKDQNAPLSFGTVFSLAWQRVEFTREALPRTLIFFAVLGIIAMGVFSVISLLLSLVITPAHAAAFDPESSDIAKAWIEYLFKGTALPDYYTNMGKAVQSASGVQAALMTALAFYSNAILIIAGLILFYHLASMVVETAHHGVVMGKNANQIWAPIRLVFAIGLLVPINSGLSSGQFIVIKVAELGSGLASQTWDIFLTGLAGSSVKPIAPNAPIVTQIAADIIASEACAYSYNLRLAKVAKDWPKLLPDAQMKPISISGVEVNGRKGTKISYSTNDLQSQDICGSYFLPDVSTGSTDPVAAAAYAAEASALTAALSTFKTEGEKIKYVMPAAEGGAALGSYTLNTNTLDAVINYQASVGTGMAKLASSITSPISTTINQMKPNGWVMAGALFPAIERIQAQLSSAVTAGMPSTVGPAINFTEQFGNNAHGINRLIPWTRDSDTQWDIRTKVSEDLQKFSIAQSTAWAQAQASNSECANMLGLTNSGGGNMAGAINLVFGLIDRLATWNDVWTSGTGAKCNGTASGLTTFRVGIDLSGPDIFTQITHLGHSNLDLGAMLLGIAIAAKVGGAIAGAAVGAAAGTAAGAATGPGALITGGIGLFLGTLAGSLLSAAAGVIEVFALIFFITGFTLAFVVPLFPFTRFFFAVLSWVGALMEAVIAIPLVALAHLNPNGEGLPGASARGAYFFVFNLFLRPVMTIFGLIAGFLIFMIAASFVTYAYSLAVSGSGGTAYGHEVMAKVIYSILYVAMMYICANHSFALIEHVPEHAIRWMGASGQSMPRLGDADKMANMETLVAGYAGSKAFGAIGQAGGNIGQGASDGIKNIQKRNDTNDAKREKDASIERRKQDDLTGTDRHNAMMGKLDALGSSGGGAGGESVMLSGGGSDKAGGTGYTGTGSGDAGSDAGGGIKTTGSVAGSGYAPSSTMTASSGMTAPSSSMGYSSKVEAEGSGGSKPRAATISPDTAEILKPKKPPSESGEA